MDTGVFLLLMRYALQGVGGVLIANGYIQGDAEWQTISGAVISVAVPALAWLSRRRVQASAKADGFTQGELTAKAEAAAEAVAARVVVDAAKIGAAR